LQNSFEVQIPLSLLSRSIFLKALGRSIETYSFDAVLFVAGFSIAIALNLFETSRWAFVLYPGLLITKSIVGRVVNERISTGLHLGTIYSRLTGNTRVFLDVFRDTVLVTVLMGLTISFFSWVLGVAFWGFTVADLVEMSVALISTLGLSLLVFPLTEKLVFEAFNRGVDLERFIHPSTFALSGLISTGIYSSVLTLLLGLGVEGAYAAIALAVLLIAVAFLDALLRVKDAGFKRFVLSFLPVFFLSAIISSVAGMVFGKISALSLGLPEIFTVYPALIFVGANLGLVVGTSATTKLALGLLRPDFRSIGHHGGQILAGWAASVLVFAVLSGVSLAVNGGSRLAFVGDLVAVLLLSNVIAVAMIVLVAYSFAVLAFQRGFELESVAIPAEETFSILMMTIALFVALVVLHYV
jgi:cation transporter-like permease